jgi:hypothetical protein
MSLLLGVPARPHSGYFGGTLDRALVLVMDALFAFPYLLIAIVIAFLLSNSSIGGGNPDRRVRDHRSRYVPSVFPRRPQSRGQLCARSRTSTPHERSGARPRTVIRKYVFFNVVRTSRRSQRSTPPTRFFSPRALGFLGYGISVAGRGVGGYDFSRAVSDASLGSGGRSLPALAIVLLVTGLTLVGEGLERGRSTPCSGAALREFEFDERSRGGRRCSRDERRPGPSGQIFASTTGRPGSRSRRRRRVARDREGEVVGLVRRVGLRKVDPRSRNPRPLPDAPARTGR